MAFCPSGRAQQIWLAPDINRTGAITDYYDLFSTGAAWQNASQKTKVFKIIGHVLHTPGNLSVEASDADLQGIFADLNRRGIALAWDTNGLTFTAACGSGVDGFKDSVNGDPAGDTLAYVRRIKALGGVLKYVEFNEPYDNGSLYEGTNACHWPAQTVAENLLLHVRAVQSVFPDVIVGDMEGVPQSNQRHGQMVATYQPWLDAWRQVSGKDFVFFQADVGWGVRGIASDLEDMRRLLASRGIAFGVMYAGHNYFQPQTDVDWTSTAERESTDYELEAGRPPDEGIIQSWDPLPSHALPETTPGSLTYLLNRYARERPQLTAAVLGAQVSGKLADSSGLAIPGASLSVAAVANSGTGIVGDFTITGFVPAGADQGTAGFRINADCNTNCNGSADLSLYRVAYAESTGYTASSDFTNGMQGWSAWGSAWTGAAQFETSSAGRGLRVTVSPTQYFGLNSPFFRMTPGATFTVTFTARVPPSASASGNYSVFLLNGNSQVMRYDHELTSGKRSLGVATTGADGAYHLGLTESFDASVSLAASYPGSDKYWPASVVAPFPTDIAVPAISGPSSLPAGQVGVAYAATTVTAAGGSGSYTWSATGLPAGLGIGSATGIISGTPTTNSGSPYSVQVTVTDSNSAQATRAYSLTINAAPADLLLITGVSNAASGQAAIAPNTWVSIYGANFAAAGFSDDWSKSIVNGNLPTILDGVSVSIGGNPAYVSFVNPGQINVLTPNVASGNASVTVTAGTTTTAPVTVTSRQFSPAFFPWPNGQPVATHLDYSWAVKNGTFAGETTVPAKPGEAIILWGTGFGPTTPTAPAGVTVPASTTYNAANSISATIGSAPASVYGAALASGFAGLYQVVVTVPATLSNGDYALVATVGGVATATTTLTVHN